MKTLRLLFVSIFFIAATQNLTASDLRLFNPNCEIGAINVEIEPCDELGYFEVVLNFEYANVGTEGFRVQGNGNNYGNFEYESLPITIGPLEGDGVTEYEFVVIDNEFEDCTNWTAIDPVDCNTGGECAIFDLVIDDHPCDGEYFNVYLNFEYENVSNEGFTLFVNDDLYESYSYEDLPLESIGPFLGDGTTFYVFEVYDQVYDDCFDIVEFGPIDCSGGGDCEIWDVVADILPCDESGYFDVVLNFEYANVGTEGFRVQGNGNNYGNFEYESLPITIGPLDGDGVTEYEFVVSDNEFEDCTNWTAIDPVDCNTGGECAIWDVEATVLPCNENGFFNVLINFEYEHVGESGFSLLGNGNDYGDFEYEDLPVELGPFEGDGITIYEFLARDNQYEDCSDWTEIDPVDCETAPQITNLVTEVSSCTDNLYQLTINFESQNIGNEGFTVSGNGMESLDFQYAELPVVINNLWTDGITAYHFIIRDKEKISYGNWNQLIPFTCENLGIPNTTSQNISVFPNPAFEHVTIRSQIADARYRIIQLFSISGEKIMDISTDNQETDIDISNLSEGLYFIRVQAADKVFMTKLVKVK